MEYREMVILAEKLAKENDGFVGGSIMLCEHGVSLGRTPKDIDIIIPGNLKLKRDLVLLDGMQEVNSKENKAYGNSIIFQGNHDGVKIDFLKPLSTGMFYTKFELEKMRRDYRWLLYASIDSAISAKERYKTSKRISDEYINKNESDLEKINAFAKEHDIFL